MAAVSSGSGPAHAGSGPADAGPPGSTLHLPPPPMAGDGGLGPGPAWHDGRDGRDGFGADRGGGLRSAEWAGAGAGAGAGDETEGDVTEMVATV
jgi:hypothetical protein